MHTAHDVERPVRSSRAYPELVFRSAYFSRRRKPLRSVKAWRGTGSISLCFTESSAAFVCACPQAMRPGKAKAGAPKVSRKQAHSVRPPAIHNAGSTGAHAEALIADNECRPDSTDATTCEPPAKPSFPQSSLPTSIPAQMAPWGVLVICA
jgi:hypothetical protein